LPGLDIARASAEDIPFIMATERLPGNEGLVGRWERDEHEQALANLSNAYFVGSIAGRPIGFVIVQRWASETGRTLIRRVIAAETGNRIGRELLSNVIAVILAETEVDLLWLNVRPNNIRAQRCYAALGFGFATRATIEEAGEASSLLMILSRSTWVLRRRGVSYLRY
jgi:ribosomal protein S18 acetylase RimI-like enzyme